MGQNRVPLVNIPKMNIIVFIGMFTYPILMVIGINPWPYICHPFVRLSPHHHLPGQRQRPSGGLLPLHRCSGGRQELPPWSAAGGRQFSQRNPWEFVTNQWYYTIIMIVILDSIIDGIPLVLYIPIVV